MDHEWVAGEIRELTNLWKYVDINQEKREHFCEIIESNFFEKLKKWGILEFSIPPLSWENIHILWVNFLFICEEWQFWNRFYWHNDNFGGF